MRITTVIFLFLLQCWALSAQDSLTLDYLRAAGQIVLRPEAHRVEGSVTYWLRAGRDTSVIALDARSLRFTSVTYQGKQVDFQYDGKTLVLPYPVKAGEDHQFSVKYTTQPQQAVYFLGWEHPLDNPQVWTQGQGKYSSHWIPSPDKMQDKVEFDLEFISPEPYHLLANGTLLEREAEQDGRVRWKYDMQKPMSSYLLAFVLAQMEERDTVSASGVPMRFYLPPKDSSRFETTFRHSREIFDFLETFIGVPYPWQEYKQVAVRDFMYAGMENTSLTLFSDRYVVDTIGFNDQNYVNVNAHELAHQWFGNLVTEKSAAHHWLHEGFATYYALLAEKELFGEAYFYWKLFDTARILEELSTNGGGEALTDPGAGSATFYEKGAWALFQLHEMLGTEVFRKGIQTYLQEHAFGTVTVEDFLEIMESTSKKDLSEFRQLWLESESFPMAEAMVLLQARSPEVACFLELERELIADPGPNGPVLMKYWEKCQGEQSRAHLLRVYERSIGVDLQQKAFEDGRLEVLRALATANGDIPEALMESYRNLLDAPSYEIRQSVLYRFWVHHPETRAAVLAKTAGNLGLPDRSMRILWLTLALLTPDYEADKTASYLQELQGYTSDQYSMETRQAALQFLREIHQLEDQNLRDLVQATSHHGWQFRKFARQLLEQLLEEDRYRRRLQRLAHGLSEPGKSYLEEKLEQP